MRIEEFLRESARRFGSKTALVSGAARVDYRSLDELSDRLASWLADNGVARDDRALVFMENTWEAVVALFAVAKAGATFSPINASTKPEKLAYIVNNCRARAIITQGKLEGIVAEALRDVNHAVATVVAGPRTGMLDGATDLDLCLERPARPPAHGGIDVDLAMLVYTSGSTGKPKGVMMTHRNVEAAASSIIAYLENTSDDTILCALPIAFDYGLYQVLMGVKLGATVVLEKSFAFPQAVFQTMLKEGVTGLPLVPTMAAMILDQRNLAPDAFPALRYITNTAAALPPAHIEKLRRLFPRAKLFSMYGLTECKRCTYLPPSELDTRPGSVGIAIPNTEAYVVDESGARAAPGEVGELVIRGPHVMQGYWEDERATATALRPGAKPWERVLYTGDLFRTDADGYLYFVGRKDDIIKTRGEKVSPKEVEAVIHAHPAVREALVVGVPDAVLGQAIHAIVVANGEPVTERQVIAHCARHLEDYMVPRRVEFRSSLPQTDTGKASRRLALSQLEPEPC